MNTPIYIYVISMLLYTLLHIVFIHISKNKLYVVSIFFVLALLTFPLWKNNLSGWFRWIKTLSILIPINYVSLVRISHDTESKSLSFLRKTWVLYSLYFFLALNFFEGVIKDASSGNYFNSITAFLLILTIPLPRNNSWSITSKMDGCNIKVNLSFLWVFTATIWNACVVYAENPGYVASSICILMAAFIYTLIKKDPSEYVTARVYTVSLHVFIRACFGDVFARVMDSSAWYSQSTAQIWGFVNLLCACIVLVLFILKKRHQYR